MDTRKIRRAPGRPPKFKGERRPVTVTLPVKVLDILHLIDPDRARAIAKLAENAGRTISARKHVHIVEVAPQRGLIVVSDSVPLRSIEGLRLVEIAPGCFLITLKSGLTVESIEVQIQDMIEEEQGGAEDIALLKELLGHLRHQRRRKTVSKEELLVIGI